MNGMLEESITHFVNAVNVSGSPNQILRLLADSLPPQVFQLIVKRVSQDPTGHISMSSSQSARRSPPGGMMGSIGEVDLEIDDNGDGVAGGHRGSVGGGAGGPTIALVDDELE